MKKRKESPLHKRLMSLDTDLTTLRSSAHRHSPETAEDGLQKLEEKLNRELFNSTLDDIEKIIKLFRKGQDDPAASEVSTFEFIETLDFYFTELMRLCIDDKYIRAIERTKNIIRKKMSES